MNNVARLVCFADGLGKNYTLNARGIDKEMSSVDWLFDAGQRQCRRCAARRSVGFRAAGVSSDVGQALYNLPQRSARNRQVGTGEGRCELEAIGAVRAARQLLDRQSVDIDQLQAGRGSARGFSI